MTLLRRAVVFAPNNVNSIGYGRSCDRGSSMWPDDRERDSQDRQRSHCSDWKQPKLVLVLVSDASKVVTLDKVLLHPLSFSVSIALSITLLAGSDGVSDGVSELSFTSTATIVRLIFCTVLARSFNSRDHHLGSAWGRPLFCGGSRIWTLILVSDASKVVSLDKLLLHLLSYSVSNIVCALSFTLLAGSDGVSKLSFTSTATIVRLIFFTVVARILNVIVDWVIHAIQAVVVATAACLALIAEIVRRPAAARGAVVVLLAKRIAITAVVHVVLVVHCVVHCVVGVVVCGTIHFDHLHGQIRIVSMLLRTKRTESPVAKPASNKRNGAMADFSFFFPFIYFTF
jgi:hypothetical protein